MTNDRFWKIVGKYEVCTDHADGIETSVSDVDSAIKEIVYYDRGDQYKSEADYGLLMQGYPDKDECKSIAQVCDEYNRLGMKEFKKKYKKVFANY